MNPEPSEQSAPTSDNTPPEGSDNNNKLIGSASASKLRLN